MFKNYISSQLYWKIANVHTMNLTFFKIMEKDTSYLKSKTDHSS